MKNLSIIISLICLFLTGCTDNRSFTTGCTEKQRAKDYGGSFTIKLECGQKLHNVTWKLDDLWYITRPMHPDEAPETYQFIEDPSFGILEGKVTFVECR